MTNKNTIILIGINILLFWLTPTLPQDEASHNFTDIRHLLLCNNSWDVFSNLPFIIFGFMGIFYTMKHATDKAEKLYLYTFFIKLRVPGKV